MEISNSGCLSGQTDPSTEANPIEHGNRETKKPACHPMSHKTKDKKLHKKEEPKTDAPLARSGYCTNFFLYLLVLLVLKNGRLLSEQKF
ncbi:hypothetical protein CEXT_64681 [Caerostris extrusa]|uniref:Uncharacterized protein n=1 Tax=Caerostris extrusa TaxID=172846 RepID=A0AAV4UX15_CAEEX|nr:hypothetical protein CEXT_64681 [Caerostris extrusa]